MLEFWLCPVQTNNAEWEKGGRPGASSLDVRFGLTNVLFI